MAAKNEKKKVKKDQPNFLALTGIGLQMGATIYLGAALGNFLDEKYLDQKNWFTIGLTLLAIVISFYNLLKQVNRLNEKDD
ncbi:MAG: AtpZ/AtpI family protein [Vicingaceae bacterium]